MDSQFDKSGKTTSLILPEASFVGDVILNRLEYSKKKEMPIAAQKPSKSEEEKLKTEPQKYLVFIPYPKKIGTKTLEASENIVKKKYLPRSNEFDIFVYSESIFVKSGKKMIRLEMDARLRKLLIIFLRYKDMSIPPIPLYRRAWAFEHAPERKTDIREDSDVTPYLKVAKSKLETLIYQHIPSFEIDKPRNQGYICKGDFNFCVILDNEDDKKYRLTEAQEVEDYS